ncbi:MAG: hypothetical protein ACUVSX_15355, partial [Aggregatilineales bacterium]
KWLPMKRDINLVQIDSTSAAALALGCGLLCVVGFVVLLALQLITGLLDAVFSLVQLAFGALTGDPLSCCGCVVVVALCGGCALAALLLSGACSTPGAPGICRVLGL